MIHAVETRNRIVGGMFGFPELFDESGSPPPFINANSMFLVNARSGLAVLVELLSPKRIWLPSYLCHTMLDGIGKSGEICFYQVNETLQIDSIEWIKRVRQGDLVIFVSYFGWHTEPEWMIKAKERGAWVLEDACQALLSEKIGNQAHFVLYSPRKFIGVPDGGILTSHVEKIQFRKISLKKPPAQWWMKAFSATVLRRDFDLYGGSRDWYRLYQEVQSQQVVGPYSMSELSMSFLLQGFDYRAIARQRIENYTCLANGLKDIALRPDLPSGVVPLGFPVRVRNRDRIRQALFRHDVFPPVHWLLTGIVPDEFQTSHQLAAEIMTLPCDQRYDTEDMRRVTYLVRQEMTR